MEPTISQWPRHLSYNEQWWTTSGGSTFLPTQYPSSSSNGGEISSLSTLPPSSGGAGAGGSSTIDTFPSTSNPSTSPSLSSGQFMTTSTTVFTTTYPITTITQPSTTFTSYSTSIVTSAVSLAASSTPTPQTNTKVDPVCLGHGLDAWSEGLIATVVLSSVIGLILWIIFAIIRPRYRQVYGLREWFPQHDLRPRPLSSSFWAFLFPHVPLVPGVPSDVSDAGKSAAADAQLFPSDEHLSQRALWIAFTICLGWSVLALGGALPLYLVSTPCLASTSANQGITTGVYSVMQDLSLLRLLQRFEDGDINTSSAFKFLQSRVIVDQKDIRSPARIRTVVLTILVLLVGVLPALWKILREFNRLVAHRKNWIEIKCEEKEMGWLSATKAPGFVGWGEKRLKEYFLKMGLSSTLDTTNDRSRNGRRKRQRAQTGISEKDLEIDVQSLFSIGDTEHLALLIDERDEILESLEIAETRYISSFRTSTPEPSIADIEIPTPAHKPVHEDTPPQDARPHISRPRPLNVNVHPNGNVQPRVRANQGRRYRAKNPAYASSSLPPTSFLMPSSYYKLRGVHGISGGQFTDPEDAQQRVRQREVSFTDTINQRVVGSRFMEVNRDSVAYGRLPLGSHVRVSENGELGPPVLPHPNMPSPHISDVIKFGPNHPWEPSSDTYNSGHDSFFQRSQGMSRVPSELDGDWIDLLHEPPQTFESGPTSTTLGGSPMEVQETRRRPPRTTTSPPSDHRETFPLRARNAEAQTPDILPPHLRLQFQQPFVRPLSGMDHSDLGGVYTDISHWRTRLKAINAEIADAQRDCYSDIADGARIKGWLMIGKGLRFLPGVELIEGRSKEDIRWDELQHGGGVWNAIAFWSMVAMILLLLAASLTAVAGLMLASSPDVARYLPFLSGLAERNDLATGLATVLCPTLAATLFIAVTMMVIHHFARFDGHVSVSGSQLAAFKTIFFALTIVAGVWLMAVGAVLFAVESFQDHTQAAKAVANGSIIMTALALTLIINVAIISPALSMLQPLRLWRVTRAEKMAITPRQRFRATYPGTYDPSYALACCILAIIFASAFALIFPLISPAVTLLLFLTLVSHRYLIGYVYGRTQSPTGGLLQIWLLRRFATLLALQPFVLGLIFLTRSLWEEAAVLLSAAVCVVVFVEIFCNMRTRQPGVSSLSNVTQESLQSFKTMARPTHRRNVDEESVSLVSTSRSKPMRESMASVLEMMSLTLAVMPSPSQNRGPVPLQTETLDDLTATERAARTHPDAPPHIPPLAFTDHAEDMAGILYCPELIAPPPIIWLPHDTAGIARSEAFDLQQYHALQVTLDVKSQEDVLPRRPTSFRRRTSR